MLKNKKLLIVVALATTALSGCNNFDNNDNSVTINEPFADAGFTTMVHTLTSSSAFPGQNISVSITPTTATLTCPAGTFPPSGFDGSISSFDSDGSYKVRNTGTVNHPLVCMDIDSATNSATLGMDTGGVAAGLEISLNFNENDIDFCCVDSIVMVAQGFN